jgi:hypothetical protein
MVVAEVSKIRVLLLERRSTVVTLGHTTGTRLFTLPSKDSG